MNEIIQDYKDEQAEYNSILQVNSLDYDLDNSSESWIPKIKINITHYETMMNHSTKVPFKEGFKWSVNSQKKKLQEFDLLTVF